MESMTKKTLLLLTMLVICGQVSADSGIVRFFKKLGTTIDTMTVRGVDPHYITAPEKPWQIIVQGNVNQTDLKMKATLDGKKLFDDSFGDIFWEPRIKTGVSTYAGVWAGYRGYGFGYSKNLIGRGSIYKFGVTGGSYGANLRIHHFSTDEPQVRLTGYLPTWTDETYSYLLMEPIKARLLTFDAYYLFNGKRFSYSAAYDQSVIQRRSSGSLMIGGMYYHSTVRYEEGSNADFILFMNDIGKFKHYQLSFGGGYAYNLVPCKGLLISGFCMLMLTSYNRLDIWRYNSNLRLQAIKDRHNPSPDIKDDNEEMSDEEIIDYTNELFTIWPMENNARKTHYSSVTPFIDARLSLTYNFGNWFINTNAQLYNFEFKHNDNKGNITDWYVNASLGLRL